MGVDRGLLQRLEVVGEPRVTELEDVVYEVDQSARDGAGGLKLSVLEPIHRVDLDAGVRCEDLVGVVEGVRAQGRLLDRNVDCGGQFENGPA